LKIRHGAIVDNVVTNVFAKFDDDRLWNEKALVLRTTRTNRTTFVALVDLFPGLKSSAFLWITVYFECDMYRISERQIEICDWSATRNSCRRHERTEDNSVE